MRYSKQGGYHWKGELAQASEAARDARIAVECLQHLTNSGVATSHLLTVALKLAAIQDALSALAQIASKGEEHE